MSEDVQEYYEYVFFGLTTVLMSVTNSKWFYRKESEDNPKVNGGTGRGPQGLNGRAGYIQSLNDPADLGSF